jgi:sugar phosphate isomerase/epimerase
MQFNMALVGGSSLPDEISAELAARIRTEASGRGLRMAAVSGTYNMAHPDADARADGQRRLAELIAATAALGTRVVTVCTGSRDATDMWRRHPDNRTPQAWRDMLASIEAALTVAEAHDVTLAFEPEHNNVVDSARAGRRLLDELRSPHLRVVIDAANLFAGGDLDRRRDTLGEAFELLGDDLVLAHAKDVRNDGTIVAAARGELDYGLYLRLLGHAGDNVPLILHGLTEDEVPDSVAFLRAAPARIPVR